MRDTAYPLTADQITSYRENGFVQLNDVITGADLERLRAAVEAAVKDETLPDRQKGRLGAYEQLFIQKVNLWRRHPVIREYVLCRRFGNIAASLSGLPMRLWHDQALFKEPEIATRTPWHQDAHYWPHVQKGNQVSIWIALEDATIRNGCMSFLPGTHVHGNIPAVDLGNPQDIFQLAPQLKGIKPVTCELKAGSCTFHNGLTFHYAGPNKSDRMREAFAILYMPDGTAYSGAGHCVIEKDAFQPGDPLDSETFPLVSEAEKCEVRRAKCEV